LINRISLGWGGGGLAALQLAADGMTLLPAGRKNDLPWYGINTIQVSLTQPAVLTAADVMLQSARGINYGPATITGSRMNYTIMFARPIDKADRVLLTIDIPDTESFSGRLNVLPGDLNGDGVVNNKDITTIRNEWKGKKGATATIYGDIIGNGTVNGSDYNAARKELGTKLPKLPKPRGKHPKAMLAQALVRQHPGVKQHG
jgi:Dockerin type I domain